MSFFQRIRQFREAGAVPGPEDRALAAELLPPPLLELFLAQHPRDVVHGVRTAQWLVERGFGDRDLLQAALLHDIGKGPQRRRDRVAYVVAGTTGAAPALASPASRWELRRAVARSLEHAESGARMLEGAGASPRVVALTRLHHAPAGSDDMLSLLQIADTAS